MKVLRDFLKVLTVVLAVATLVAFFFPLVSVATNAGDTISLTGAELAFGADKSAALGADSANLWKSGWFFASFIFGALTAIFAAVGFFKSQKWNGAALVTGLINAIIMLVIRVSTVGSYVDLRNLMSQIDAESASYNFTMTLMMILSIATLVICAVMALVRDKVAVMESNGSKISIPAKVKKFLREYKSEIKKIVWPTGRSVVKNTIVVLVMCAIVLLLVWAGDTGMGELLKLTYGVSAS